MEPKHLREEGNINDPNRSEEGNRNCNDEEFISQGVTTHTRARIRLETFEVLFDVSSLAAR